MTTFSCGKNLIIFDENNGFIKSIFCENSEIIYGKTPVFSLKFRKNDNSSFVISCFDFTYQGCVDNAFVYSSDSADVHLYLRQTDSGLTGRVKVYNKTKMVIEWVELLSFSVYPNLIDENGYGSILFPYNEGCIVTNLKRRENSPFPYIEPEYPSLGKYCIFPNMICAQFISYLKNDSGIILSALDKNRGVKHIDFKRENESLKIFIRTYTGANYSEDYTMDYDMHLTLFKGDFYDACEIYRNWLYDNLPVSLVKISDNKLLPTWYRESPLILDFPIRGRFDTDTIKPNGFYPYENSIKICKEISKLTESKVMELLMQWESNAPWAPPYSWPPYGGVTEFNEFVSKSHKNNMLVGLYCSGLGWTQYSKLVSSYNKENVFIENNYKEIICTNSNGEALSKIVDNIRKGYDICPYPEQSKLLLSSEMNKVINSGVDYVQVFDQNHGGNSYFCFSDKHGHPPVPGSWQVKATYDLLTRLENDKNKVLLGCESGASEPFISKLLFSDNRFNLNYYVGMPFPLYSYLFHEFVNNFMGNQICMTLSKEDYNYSYRVAYSFICGDMLTAVISDRGDFTYSWCDLETTNKSNAIEIFKNLNHWRTGIGANYLHLGKMVRPIEVVTDTKTFKCEDSTLIHVNGVQTSAFAYENNVMQFIVNYQNEPLTIKLDKKYDIYYKYDSDNFINDDKVTINKNDAIMIRIK